MKNLLLRNAWLRAWRAHGLPIEGRWEMLPPGRRGRTSRDVAEITLRCIACGKAALVERREAPIGDAWVMRYTEKQAVSTIVYNGHCKHLLPYLIGPPPEVEALALLELISGEVL